MIEVMNLCKRFKSVQALNGISLNVRPGEIYGFIGHNGAGKSTTMNILAGLSRPDSGHCRVNGKDVTAISHPSELGIGYLPEEPRFYPWLTAKEFLTYLGRGGPDPVSRRRIEDVLNWVGLTDAANRRAGGFSRGMRQRLGIGAALLKNPDLLILDEPSSALDPEGRSEVLKLILDLKRQGKTVILSSHILSDVERVCDTVGMIAAGRMVMEKPLAAILSDVPAFVFEITLPSACSPETENQVRSIPGVIEVVRRERDLAVTVADAHAGSINLMGFFAEKSIAVEALGMRKNSLEDIFIHGVNGK